MPLIPLTDEELRTRGQLLARMTLELVDLQTENAEARHDMRPRIERLLQTAEGITSLEHRDRQDGALAIAKDLERDDVADESTIQSDVKLPSLWDQADIGEVALKSPMPFDTIEAVGFEKVESPLFKAELKQRSATRIAADPEFRWIMDDIERTKKRIAENKVSLNEKVRRA